MGGLKAHGNLEGFLAILGRESIVSSDSEPSRTTTSALEQGVSIKGSPVCIRIRRTFEAWAYTAGKGRECEGEDRTGIWMY